MFTVTVRCEPAEMAHAVLSRNEPEVLAEHNPTWVTAVDAGKLNVALVVEIPSDPPATHVNATRAYAGLPPVTSFVIVVPGSAVCNDAWVANPV
jgi:hypothetical protein